MMIWLIFAGMTAAVVAVLLVPFTRKLSGSLNSDAEFDRAVYRDQLQELERDQGRGLIGAAEADAARNEISRRLLQVAKPKAVVLGSKYSLLAVLLAPAYKREQRWGDAADAYANILQLAPPTSETIADYGEMLVFANEGMVTNEAERAFAEALKLDAKNPRARFYYDMALKQEGKGPVLSDEQITAGQALTTQDQTAMIAGMMDGLELKLG